MANLADLNLDQLESFMKNNEVQPSLADNNMNVNINQNGVDENGNENERSKSRRKSEERKLKKKKHRSSRSRSSRSSRSRDRDGKKKSKKHKKKSHKRSYSSRRKNSKSLQQEQPMTEQERLAKQQMEQIEKTQQQIKMLEEKFKQAEKEKEEALREDMTIMIYSLPTSADEKDIYKYLQFHKIGKIRDIKIIRDQRSRKSKGVCYVEFFDQDAVQRTLLLNNRPFVQNGKEIKYSAIKVQHSQAEKNRNAAVAKSLKEQKQKALQEQLELLNKGPMKIYVGGLTDSLATITDNDLKNLFETFGPIDQIDVHRDQDGKCKGYAYITFRVGDDAQKAIKEMNDFKVGEKEIKVTSLQQTMLQGLPLLQLQPHMLQQEKDLLSQQQQPDLAQGELDEEHGGNFLHTAQSRLSLMQKLNRDQIALPNQNQGQQPVSLNPLLQGMAQTEYHNPSHPPQYPAPSNFLFIGNMFTGEEVQEEPTFFSDLQEDVEEECKNFGQIRQVIVDTKSKGNIFVEFQDPSQAQICQANMSQRYYNNQKIISYFVTREVYQQQLQNLD